MSFILDALRKSEHDRQREKGPGLAEVAVSPPKPKKNVWATVAVGLLVINLLAVGVLLLRRAGQHSNATVTNTAATGGAATGAGTDTLDAPQPTRDPPVAAATGSSSNESATGSRYGAARAATRIASRRSRRYAQSAHRRIERGCGWRR